MAKQKQVPVFDSGWLAPVRQLTDPQIAGFLGWLRGNLPLMPKKERVKAVAKQKTLRSELAIRQRTRNGYRPVPLIPSAQTEAEVRFNIEHAERAEVEVLEPWVMDLACALDRAGARL